MNKNVKSVVIRNDHSQELESLKVLAQTLLSCVVSLVNNGSKILILFSTLLSYVKNMNESSKSSR